VDYNGKKTDTWNKCPRDNGPKKTPAKYIMFCIWSQIKQKASTNNSTPDQEIIFTKNATIEKKKKKHATKRRYVNLNRIVFSCHYKLKKERHRVNVHEHIHTRTGNIRELTY
jgi:hypothetical protein